MSWHEFEPGDVVPVNAMLKVCQQRLATHKVINSREKERHLKTIVGYGADQLVYQPVGPGWGKSPAPGRGSSNNPSRRSRRNRARHLPTVAGDTRTRLATTVCPSAHANTMHARRASCAESSECVSAWSNRQAVLPQSTVGVLSLTYLHARVWAVI